MRCLLIGTGSIGRRHASTLRRLVPDIRIHALRSGQGDPLPAGLADSEDTSIDAAKAWQPDVVVVANPAPMHADSAIPFVSAGLPVFIEKPLTTSHADAERLLQAGINNSRILVGYVLRHNRSLAVFRGAISSQRAGRLVSLHLEAGQALADWRPGTAPNQSISARPGTGGGVLYELSHELDMVRWLGGEVETVQALAATRGELDLAVEDVALVALKCQNGLPVVVQIDMARRPARRRYRAIGTKGAVTWDAATGVVQIETADGEQLLHAGDPDRETMFDSQMRHFLALAEGKATSVCGLHDAVATLDVVLAARAVAGLETA